MVAPSCLNVTLYVHILSCYLSSVYNFALTSPYLLNEKKKSTCPEKLIFLFGSVVVKFSAVQLFVSYYYW